MSDRTVIYCLATEEAPELNAIAARCREVCRSQGWEVVRHVRERDPDRPKLAALADEAAAGGIERVLFHTWDCMAAGPGIEDWHPQVYRLHRAGIRVSLATV